MKVNSILIAFFLCAISFISGNSQEDNKRTNIVFMVADDWSFPHAGVYGDAIVRTPTFDRISKMGASFTNAYCAAPSCSPSRASILTSRYPHQNDDAGNLWSIISTKYANWMSVLSEAAYHTGKSRKGWAPGNYKMGGYEENPAGKNYSDFRAFMDAREKGEAFAYWFGSSDPHRRYETNTGVKSGMDQSFVKVPEFLPDLPCVRNDILDYYYEVERFDRECGNIMNILAAEGELENTIIVMTSDNGMPFPRAKANLYDYGTRMPLAIYWKGNIEGGKQVDAFVNFIDFGPTFLKAAGLQIPNSFQGSPIQEIFTSNSLKNKRDRVYLERERHANVRQGNLSYPIRAVRTAKFLYIKNFEPDRWPAGDPNTFQSVGQFGDVDNSITKFLIMDSKDGDNYGSKVAFYDKCFGKRPNEEFYVLENDPSNLINEIGNEEYSDEIEELRKDLNQWMERTGDRRAEDPRSKYWDKVYYTPDYQFKNFDLQEQIDAYKMMISEGGRMKKMDCRN